MKCVKKQINFDLNTLMVEELPWSQAFYREGSIADAVFKEDVTGYFEFALNNQAAMPFYTLKLASCAKIETTFERAYAQLVDAVGRLFNEDHATLMHFMGCDFLRKHPYFIEYAKWSFRDTGSARQALYGRFDAAFNPVTEEVTGIYEFNGDTPTMLFESVNLQNRLCEAFTGDTEDQLNSFYPILQGMLEKVGKIPGSVAVLFEKDSFEDTVTAETLCQIFGENNTAYMASFEDIDYDHAVRDQPFVIENDRPTVIFALSPWEEMVENFPQAYKEWANWASGVTFLEPAWRWFTSNKGIWAYITHLHESDPAGYGAEWADVPTLPTYVSTENHFLGKRGFVEKPKVGRMSSNVKVFDQFGTCTHETDGPYPDDSVVQGYHAPYQVEGRNNFIIGMFMVPDAVNVQRDMLGATAATLCIREFESPTLSWKNERFIPHILV
jgi:glutathionylspermidine synthase